ncbi:MAG: polysaccharide biosynthesis C-terminal domain-containing protein [Acidimicrobiales bacterium]
MAGPLLGLRGMGQLLEFLGWIVIARRLGASVFGELAIAFLIARYAGLVADWGASVRGVRDAARDDDSLSTSRALIRRRTWLTAVLTASYVVGAVLVGRADLAPVALVIVALGMSRDWLALGRQQAVRAAIPACVQGALLAATSVLAGGDLLALPVGLGYGAAAVTSLSLNRLPRRAPGRPLATSPVDGWMLGAVVANQVLSSADTLLLGALVSSTAAGIYAAVYRIPNAWLAAVAILGSALLPLTTQAADDHQAYWHLGRRSLRVSTAAAGLLLVVTPLLVALVPVVFGSSYEEGRAPMAILLLATVVATGAAPLHHLYLAVGRDRTYFGFLAWAAVVNLACNLVLIPLASMTGAAMATLVANVVLAGELGVAVWRHRHRHGPRPEPAAP